jgi:hypothetical protein
MADVPAFTFTDEVRPVCHIGLSDVRQAEPDEWLDVGCYVHRADVFRGRDRFTERFQPGTLSLTLDNRTGWADAAGNPVDVIAAPVRPGRWIRLGVQSVAGGGYRWLFRGFIDATRPEYHPTLHDVVHVEAFDALGESGSTQAGQIALDAYQDDTAAERVGRVLDAVGWFPAKRDLEVSTVQVQPTTLGGQAIDLMGAAAQSAGGVVYGDTNGNVVYRGLTWGLYDPDDPPDAVIGNIDPGIPPAGFSPSYLNPRRGYVWWPDPPPLLTPTVIIVDVGTDWGAPDWGVIIDGPGWGLEVDYWGNVIWWNSGHWWNLGPVPTATTGETCWGLYWDPATGEARLITSCDDWTPALEGEVPLGVEVPSWQLLDHQVHAPVADTLPASGFYEVAVWADSPSGGLTALTGPQVSFDTRTWNGADPWPNAIPTGPEEQLNVRTDPYVGDVVYQSADELGGGSVADIWNELGGGLFSAPFTAVFAVGPLGEVDGAPGHAFGRLRWQGFGQVLADLEVLVDPYPSSGEVVSAAVELRAVAGTGDRRVQASADTFEHSVVVVTLNPAVGGSGAVWRNGEALPVTMTDTGAPSWSVPTQGDAQGFGVTLADYVLGWNQRPVSAGRWPTGCYAMALYRGTPSARDVETLTTYYRESLRFNGATMRALVVFVTAAAGVDVSDDLEVSGTGLAFVRQHVQPKAGAARSQGATWVAALPDGLEGHTVLTISWGPTVIDMVSWSVFGVANTTASGAVGGAVFGTGEPGTAVGPGSFGLAGETGVRSVVLAHLGAHALYDPDSGAAPGPTFVETGQHVPADQNGYVQSMAQLGVVSATPVASWADLQTGDALTSSACGLAIELVAGEGDTFENDGGTGPITIGAQPYAEDPRAYTGAIRRVAVYDPDGTLRWEYVPTPV